MQVASLNKSSSNDPRVSKGKHIYFEMSSEKVNILGKGIKRWELPERTLLFI